MRKRIIALLAAALMICLLFPVAAWAEAEEEIMETAEQLDVASLPPVESSAAAEPAPTEALASIEPEETPSEDVSPVPTPEQAVIETRVAGSGTLNLSEADGTVVHLDREQAFTVEQGTQVIIDAVPDEGSTYVKAVYNGSVVESAPVSNHTERLSFVASKSGPLEVTFAPEPKYEIQFLLSENVLVSYSAGAQERTAISGESVSFAEGTKVTFRVTTLNGASFDGADYNGKAIAAAKNGGAWMFDLDVKANGILAVRATSACTVSTILANTELLYDNNGKWQPVKEGDKVLSLPGGTSARFAVKPRVGYTVSAVLVDGKTTSVQTVGDEQRFTVTNVHGLLTITAVAEPRVETVQGIDPKTGVRYKLPGSSESDVSNITSDSWISVVKVTNGAAYDQALAESKPYGELLSAYDLTLHNENGIYEPNVPITVSFPIPDTYSGMNLKVLHAKGQSISEVPYRTEDIQGVTCVTISADAFSLYMLVDGPAEPALAVGDVEGSIPKDPHWPWIVGILGLCVGLLIFFYRKHLAPR